MLEAVAGVALAALLFVVGSYLKKNLWTDPRRRLREYREAGVPCEPFRFLLGQLPELRRYTIEGRSMEFFGDAVARLGRVYASSLGPMVVLNVCEPSVIRQVLRKHRDKYTKSSETMKRALRPLLGNGLLMSEGEVWKRQRKLLAPAFHFRALQEMVPLMVGAVNLKVRKWRGMFAPGQRLLELDFQHELSDTTLEVVATAAFGPAFLRDERVAAVLNRAFNVVLHELQERAALGLSVLPVLRSVPTPGKLRVDRGCAAIVAEVRRVIRERRAGVNRAASGRDLLDMLIEASDSSDDGGMTEQYVVDEAVTFVFAAFETVANGFTWLARFLVERPEVARACREEAARVLPKGGDPGYEELARMHYINAVILESLRLFPPAPMISKHCEVPHELELPDGRRVPVPRGAVVSVNAYEVHRHPGHWGEDALEFRPERWMDADGGSAASAPTFGAFVAFSEGARACLGRPFAMLEMKVMLCRILQEFDLEDTSGGEPIEAVFDKLNLVPRNGCGVGLVRRE